MKTKALAITSGDPSGIGPEICLKLAQSWQDTQTRLIFTGNKNVWLRAMKYFGIELRLEKYHRHINAEKNVFYYDDFDAQLSIPDDFILAKNDAICGAYSYQLIVLTCQAVLEKKYDAIVTAPVSKQSINMAGINFIGHTELVASLSQSESYAMLQYSKELTVIFATTHIALKDIFSALSVERIVWVTRLLHEFLSREKPNIRLAISGLNPHAGENGLIGTEEMVLLQPAIERIRSLNIDIDGPFPPDTIFLEKNRRIYDGFISLYHDQGHIPFKLLSFDVGVNITLGLKNLIRTSVDHGVGFDIAWQNKASFNSLKQACLKASSMI